MVMLRDPSATGRNIFAPWGLALLLKDSFCGDNLTPYIQAIQCELLVCRVFFLFDSNMYLETIV